MKKYSYLTATSVMSAAVVMSGCAGTEESTENEIVGNVEEGSSTPQPNDAFNDIDVSGTGEIPDGLATADDPEFSEGDIVIINATHFGGMEGAEGTIVGAYTSNAYSVSYEPSDGRERVEDFHWIIDEEIRAGTLETPYAEGDEVEITTERVTGIYGVMAEIQSVQEDATIYMVDFSLTDSEETVLNYQWLAEDELSAE